MELTQEETAKFNKLGISSWSELALLIPYAYEDYRIHNALIPKKKQVIDATVESVHRAPNSIQVNLYAHNFGYQITGVMFRPKQYMMHLFTVGNRDFFYGAIDCKAGHCTMSMPKKISAVGMVAPKYKSALRSDIMQNFIHQSLSIEKLLEEQIRFDVASQVMQLHHPDESILSHNQPNEASLHALKYIELHVHIKALAGKRRYFEALRSKKSEYHSWSESLPFVLTQEQVSAIEDIQKDFAKKVAAKRMIVGDVGSGKTMVILASAFMMLPFKSILMAPTTILAQQLFEEAQKFLPNAKSVLVTNKTKKVDLQEFDFIIGTHALLHRKLPEAGLVMVDEQHRFGTAQRNMLEKLVTASETNKKGKKPHYLQFSATPIPRTQAMIETANVDVSLITATPFEKNITSKVIQKKDFASLLEHIESEIEKNNQILLVYPLVEQSDVISYQSIDEARGYWEKRYEDVYVTHGQDKEKEQVLIEFKNRGKILIATTVVEVGISLPRLTTVVIVGAERLGLSTLHQLRGRVSRTGLQGYCFLYTNLNQSQRLEEFVQTTNGFEIANLDLKYRKSGDLLTGKQQSGSQFKWVDLVSDEDIVQRVKTDLGI